ncbi:MAG: RagB/SusD family nutrient uptake outer membrane protein [Prevotella sp.]
MLCVTGCDDYLTETPKYSLTTDNAVKNYENAQSAIRGIYGQYELSTNLGGTLYGMQHCMAGFWTCYTEMYDMTYTQTTDNSMIKIIWKQLYVLLNNCNFAINSIENAPDSEFPSTETKRAMIGEARCFRGYINLQLLWLFGHWFDSADSKYGIIYRDEISDMANIHKGRITVGESYEKIIEDFVYAEQYADEYSTSLHMNREFAKAMHAKLLLVRGWEGDYAEALKLVNELLKNKQSKWGMETNLATLYESGWNSKENSFSRYLGDKASASTGMASVETLYSQTLFDNPEFTADVSYWLEEDPRSVVYFGSARSYKSTDKTVKDNILVKMYHAGAYEGKNDMYATYPMRYAELYLMKAELIMRTSPEDITGALASINEMRQNYVSPALPPITQVKTYDEMMDTIFKEYVVTLFMENETPWFASLRIMHNGKPWLSTIKPEIPYSSDQYCWPIPEDEILANEAGIEQNPGLE